MSALTCRLSEEESSRMAQLRVFDPFWLDHGRPFLRIDAMQALHRRIKFNILMHQTRCYAINFSHARVARPQKRLRVSAFRAHQTLPLLSWHFAAGTTTPLFSITELCHNSPADFAASLLIRPPCRSLHPRFGVMFFCHTKLLDTQAYLVPPQSADFYQLWNRPSFGSWATIITQEEGCKCIGFCLTPSFRNVKHYLNINVCIVTR